MDISTEKTSNEYLRVNSCAKQHLFGKDRVRVRKGGRVDWHILYITRGFCIIESESECVRVGKGNIILFKPNEPQKYSFLGADDSVSRYIHFCGRDCEKMLRTAGIYSRLTYVGESGILESIHDRLCDEYWVKKPFFEEMCAGILSEFIMKAGRLAFYKNNNISVSNVKNMDKICTLMRNEISNTRKISEYAKLLNLSTDRFSHAFKESIGISPKQYIINMKINTATELLSSTNMTVSAVAEAVGISDYNYFSRLIKGYTGNSPLYYRK